MEGVSLGFILLRWNGLLIAFGIVLGAFLATLEAKRRFQDAEVVYYLFVPLTLFGWLGARLWHIFTPPLSSVQLGLTTQYYLSHPLDILSFWTGGFGIPGALLGGVLALLVVARKEKLPFWDLADMLAPGIVLAQVIGRLGNYFNQELYGLPTNLPWAIFIQPENRLHGYEQVEFYHPLFAYEALLCIVCLVLLLWLARGRFAGQLKPGDVFLTYLVSYALIRFLLEVLRLDVSLVNNLNVNQVFFACVFIVAGGMLVHRRLAPVL